MNRNSCELDVQRNNKIFEYVECRNVLCCFMLNINLGLMVPYWCSGLYLLFAFPLVGWIL